MPLAGKPRPLGVTFWYQRSQVAQGYPSKLRAFFMLAAQGEAHWRRGWQYAEELAQQTKHASNDLFRAYLAVFRMTQARYSLWPLEQFNLANTGVTTLEGLMPEEPGFELRWVRTAAYLHLPTWYGKGQLVADDQLRLADAVDEVAKSDQELSVCIADFLITADQLPLSTQRHLMSVRDLALARF